MWRSAGRFRKMLDNIRVAAIYEPGQKALYEGAGFFLKKRESMVHLKSNLAFGEPGGAVAEFAAIVIERAEEARLEPFDFLAMLLIGRLEQKPRKG